jgi:alpha-tubulin suppressor-like RCC1 family protein
MSRRSARIWRVAITVALGWCVGCLDSTAPLPRRPDRNPFGLIVSSPLPASGTQASTLSTAPQTGSVVYVSLLSDSVPDGTLATIRNRATGQSVTVPVVNGGFDPVAIGASEGDTLDVKVQRANGATPLHGVIVVRAARPPVVVRTNPPDKKTDVPLNSLVSVVFSEPVVATTVTSASVQLLQGSQLVGGSVQVGGAPELTATFTPAGMLAPRTDYRIVITTDILGADGEPLSAPVTVSFTTGESVQASIASVTITPSHLDSIYTLRDTFRLTANARDAQGNLVPGAVIDWTSSNTQMPFVVPANGGGTTLVIATSGSSVVFLPWVDGSTTIRAASGLASASLTVNVRQRVARLFLAPDSVELITGEPIEIQASTADAHGMPMQLPTFASSDSAVANAVWGSNEASAPVAYLSGFQPGLATVTASVTTVDTTLVAVMKVSVIAPPPVAFVTLSPRAVGAVVGGVVQMTATLTSVTGHILDRPVKWTSSDPTVATLDTPTSSNPAAIVTGRAPGSVTITASSEGRTDTTTIVFGRVTYTAASSGMPTCALSESGVAYCWTYNFGYYGQHGQLGDGSMLGNPTPIAVAGGRSFTAVSAGWDHTCALTSDGVAYCWGQNAYGALGIGPSAGCVNESDASCSTTTPTAVAGGLGFAAISAAWLHTCAIAAGGGAYCWGLNRSGELGNASTTPAFTPTPVAGGLTFASINAGNDQTCGVTLTGAAYCWGDNRYGQLGDGTTVARSEPVAVTSSIAFTTVSVSSTGQFACGLATDGTAHCWGRDIGARAAPCDGVDGIPCSSTPVAVPGGYRFISVSAGGGHACGLTSAATAYCWGAGYLGTGIDSDPQPVPQLVSGGHSFASLAAGGASTCAVTSAHELYCWGPIPEPLILTPGGGWSVPFSSVPRKVVGQP